MNIIKNVTLRVSTKAYYGRRAPADADRKTAGSIELCSGHVLGVGEETEGDFTKCLTRDGVEVWVETSRL